MFGGCDVVCRWGRVDNPRRTERIEPFATQGEAFRHLEELSMQRLQKGFTRIPPLSMAA